MRPTLRQVVITAAHAVRRGDLDDSLLVNEAGILGY